jgi:hypothetical protein
MEPVPKFLAIEVENCHKNLYGAQLSVKPLKVSVAEIVFVNKGRFFVSGDFSQAKKRRSSSRSTT